MTSLKSILQKIDSSEVSHLQRLAKFGPFQLFRTIATSRLRARSLTAKEARAVISKLWTDR